MAEMWKPQPREVYLQWCNDILGEASEELNDWESTFVTDIKDKLDKKMSLTEKQADKLENIYARYTK